MVLTRSMRASTLYIVYASPSVLIAPNRAQAIIILCRRSTHARFNSPLAQLRFEIPPDVGVFVFVLDLRTALFNAAIYDVLKYFILFAVPANRQVTSFSLRSIEVLMKP